MKKNKNALWLIILPFSIPAFVFGLRHLQNQQTTNYSVGVFKDLKVGERAAVKKLSGVLSDERDKGQILVSWYMVQPTPGPRGSTWLCGIIYDHQNDRLHKYVLSPNDSTPADKDGMTIAQYSGVSENSLYAVAANSGLISDVTQHGAVRKHHYYVEVKRGQMPELEW